MIAKKFFCGLADKYYRQYLHGGGDGSNHHWLKPKEVAVVHPAIDSRMIISSQFCNGDCSFTVEEKGGSVINADGEQRKWNCVCEDAPGDACVERCPTQLTAGAYAALFSYQNKYDVFEQKVHNCDGDWCSKARNSVLPIFHIARFDRSVMLCRHCRIGCTAP